MDADVPPEPVRRDPFLARVLQLAADPSVQIDLLEPTMAVLRPAGGKRRILIARHDPDNEAAIFERIGKMTRSMGPLGLEVLLVGGPERVRDLLKRTRPLFTPARQYLYHQADDGGLWSDREGPTFAALATAPPELDQAALQRLRDKAIAGHQVAKAERAELTAFVGQQRAARPVLTRTVLGVIGAVFLMEAAFGGVEAAPTLIHMGAFHAPLVERGEIWRFASATFLHAGVLHALMNCYVLLALGSFLEKIIGRWRFALLYSAAAFAGSFASYLRLEHGFSVGASGALWGCLGAHAVLAFRPGGLLPQAMIPGARNAAMINLFINILISTRPHVDWAAHAGGGLMGAVLMHLVLRRGLPPLGSTDAEAGPPVDHRPRAIAPVAVILSSLLVGGLLIALVTGRPWELTATPKLEARAVPELGATVDVPQLLSRRSSEDVGDGVMEVTFGELPLDPAVVGVARFPAAPLAATDVASTQQQLRDEMREELSKQFTAIQEPRDATIGGHPAVVARYRAAESGVEIDLVAVLFDGATYRVQVGRMPGYDSWKDVAERVAATVRPAR